MNKIFNIEIEFSSVAQILAQHPQLKNELATFEFTLPLKTSAQLKSCQAIANKLNTFFCLGKDILNPITFEFKNFDEENIIEGSFITTFDLSNKELNTFANLLAMNLDVEQEFKFNPYVIVRTTTHKFIMANELI